MSAHSIVLCLKSHPRKARCYAGIPNIQCSQQIANKGPYWLKPTSKQSKWRWVLRFQNRALVPVCRFLLAVWQVRAQLSQLPCCPAIMLPRRADCELLPLWSHCCEASTREGYSDTSSQVQPNRTSLLASDYTGGSGPKCSPYIETEKRKRYLGIKLWNWCIRSLFLF